MENNKLLIVLILFLQGLCCAGFAQTNLNPCREGCQNLSEGKVSKTDQTPIDSVIIASVIPWDPNEIIGLDGYDAAGSVDTFRWVSATQTLAYTVYFENDADLAMAAARKVSVTVPLHEKLNFATFGVGNFGFGSHIFEVEGSPSSYQTRIDLRDTLGIFVDVVAGFDILHNEAFWIFQSIDPATGLPPIDINSGFLPINDSLHSGEGFVSFTVKPKEGQCVTGDTVTATASIVFDVNEAITTNTWVNTIDAFAPTSTLTITPNAAGDMLAATFAGEDDEGGCGIKQYKLYYSVNGSSYQLYDVYPVGDTAEIPVETGMEYEFFTLAEDNVGNCEQMKTQPEYNIGTNFVTLAVNAFPQEAGTVTGAGTYSVNDTAVLSATASEGYHFVSWMSQGVPVSTENPYSAVVSQDQTYTAYFERNAYTLQTIAAVGSSITVTDLNGNEVPSGSAVLHFDQLLVSIDTADCYTMDSVLLNGAAYIPGDILNVTENITLTTTTEPIITFVEVQDVVCQGYPYEGYGFVIAADSTAVPGLIERTVTVPSLLTGCDSVTHLQLIVNPTDFVELTETACNSFTWNDSVYSQSGDYVQTFTKADGCDSVVTLHLTLNFAQFAQFADTACGSYTWNDSVYFQSGDYVQTFTKADGCDSIVTLHLTLNFAQFAQFADTACGSYTWNDSVYTQSGDYVQTFTNTEDCDSVVTLHLTINYSNTGDTTAVACDSFDWYEHTNLTQSGDYTHTFTNIHGCDSVVTLHLTVNTCDPDAVVVVIVGNNETDVYDGAEHDVSGYEVGSIMIGGVATTLYTEADFSLAAGVTATASRTDVGRTNMGLSAASFVNNNTAFETVMFHVTDGYQTITPRLVTLTSASDSREYNGDSLTNHNMTVGGDGFVDGEGATYEFTGGQLLPGSSDNTFNYTLNDGTQADNYDITTEYGTLTVENRPFADRYVVEMVSNTIPISIDEPIVYDGLEHTIEDFVTHTFTVNGNIYTVSGLTASVTQIFAGTYENVIEGTPIVRDVYGNDVTAQFDVQFRTGTLTISKRNITFTIDNEEVATKEYDGTPLTVSFNQLHVEGLAETDTLIAGTITTDNYVVGEYPISEGSEFYTMAAGSSIKSGFKIKHASGALAAALASYTPSFTITLKIIPSTLVPCVGVDYRGHHYDAVQIGSQCWLAENLRNTEDAAGNAVAYRPVNDDPATVDEFGYLYSWYSAVGVEEGNDAVMPATHTDGSGGTYVQGICPTDWAIPSHEDVNILRAAISDDASVLKDVDPQYWIVGSAGVTPNTGFNARAEGLYNSTTERFEKSLLYAYFWESDSQLNISDVISAVIAYYCDNVMEEVSPKSDLRPVRCLRKVTH